jgi:D-glycero-D-manno-heptose 1,7-bisphosphate phosphatase
LDRDGVLNVDRHDYTWKTEEFEMAPGAAEAAKQLKANGFTLVVITNQAGISKGLYGWKDVEACHAVLQAACANAIDAFYVCPYHNSITESLGRKPGTLHFERAIHRHRIDPKISFMVGDMERDLIPAKAMGITTFLIRGRISQSLYADYVVDSLLEVTQIISGLTQK